MNISAIEILCGLSTYAITSSAFSYNPASISNVDQIFNTWIVSIVSPMLKEDQGQDQNLGGYRDLNISILSNEKYPMENDIEMLDTLLL